MNAKEIFFNVLKEEFIPKLRSVGFKGSRQNFRRINGEVINTINIQVTSGGGRCAVNLGLHLTFLPSDDISKLPDVKKIREVECEFRMRLAPKNIGDYWWEYDELSGSPSEKARHLIETYFEYGEPSFKKFDEVEKIASMVSIEDIVGYNYYTKIFGCITQARVALAMARIHKHLGNISKAQDFAKIGLDFGAGSALQPIFEEIINTK